MSFRMEFVGVEELRRRCEALRGTVRTDAEISQVFLAAARAVRDAARAKAPRGKHPAFGRKQPGRLKAAIMAKAYKPKDTKRYGPGAFAQVNLKITYGRTAPYGLIVEKGRKSRSEAGSGYFHWRGPYGRWTKTKAVRGFSGRRFFEAAVREVGPTALERATAKLATIIEKKARANT